jgi:alkylhydroperoxidase family enzyme
MTYCLRSLATFLLTFVFLAALAFSVPAAHDAEAARLVQKRDNNLPARVSYVFPEPGTDPIADAIRARRANGTLLALDGVLLNAPQIARTWNNLFGVIRDNNSIPAAMRELFILRIAVLNNASYEWIQHEPVGRSVGLTTNQLLAIRLTPPFPHENGVDLRDTFEPDLIAALEFTDHITKNIAVPDAVFNGLASFLNDTQMVEAVSTTGGYNFVSRFVKSLNVDGKMDVPVPMPQDE